MDYRVCPLCGLPVAPEDDALHCLLERLDEVEKSRTAEAGRAPPRTRGGSERRSRKEPGDGQE